MLDLKKEVKGTHTLTHPDTDRHYQMSGTWTNIILPHHWQERRDPAQLLVDFRVVLQRWQGRGCWHRVEGLEGESWRLHAYTHSPSSTILQCVEGIWCKGSYGVPHGTPGISILIREFRLLYSALGLLVRTLFGFWLKFRLAKFKTDYSISSQNFQILFSIVIMASD